MGDHFYNHADTTPFVLVLGIFLFAFSLTLRNAKKWFHAWRRTGFAVVMPATAFLTGFALGLHVILLAALPPLSSEAIGSFAALPKHQHFPDRFPSEVPYGKWTAQQKYWFNPTANNNREQVKAERREEWCGLRNAALQTQKFEIQSNINAGTQIKALLWNGQMEIAASEGCISHEALLVEHNGMAQVVISQPDVFNRTWEPLSIFRFIDTLLSARYLVQPQLYPTVARYCPMIAGEENQGLNLDMNRVTAFCSEMDTRWSARYKAQHPDPPITWWQSFKWRWDLDFTGMNKYQVQNAPRMSADDLKWVRKELLDNKKLWLDPL